MKLRKLLAVTAVAATMTAAFAVNAMAETPNKFTNFKYEDGVITLNADADAVQIPVQSAGPYTMLVVRVDDTGLADTEIADTDIKQIDQADAPFTTIKVGDLTVAVEDCETCSAVEGKETCTCTHTYEIRLGGDGNVRWGTLTIEPESSDSEYYDDGTIWIGDADVSGAVTIGDASTLVNYIASGSFKSKDAKQASDVDESGAVTIGDVSTLVNQIAAGTAQSKTIGEKTDETMVKDFNDVKISE